MGPHNFDICRLAVWNPRVALAILRGQNLEPVIFNIKVQFDVAAAGTHLEAGLDTVIVEDTWIDDVIHTVERPAWLPCSAFKAQSDHFNSLNPYVNIKFTVFGAQRYLVTPKPTPIQNVTERFCECWPGGWTLFYQQTIEAEFTLTRTLCTAQGNSEVPYKVTFTLRGWQLNCQTLLQTTEEEARRILDRDYCIPYCSPKQK